MVPDIQGSRNSRRGSLVIAMLGVVLVVTGVGTTVRLQSISKEQHPSSVTSKLSVNVTNRTVVATPPSPTAVPTHRPTPILPTTARLITSPSMIPTVSSSSSCANSSVHNTKRIQKRLHVGTRHMQWSGLVPTEEMALEQAILKRIEAVCGCTHHFPTLFQPYRNNTMVPTFDSTPSHDGNMLGVQKLHKTGVIGRHRIHGSRSRLANISDRRKKSCRLFSCNQQ